MDSFDELSSPQAAIDWLQGTLASGEIAKGPMVIWAFHACDNFWCVRREGSDVEVTFASRAAALTFARKIGAAWGSYRLFFPLGDGRMTRELFNTDRSQLA